MSPRKKTSSTSNPKKTTKTTASDVKASAAPGVDLTMLNISYPEIKERLIEIIKEKSVFDQDMILPSGRITSEHLDMKETVLGSEGAFLASMAILYHLQDEVNAIGGAIEHSYSIPISCLQLAYLTGRKMNSFYVRNEDNARRFGVSKYIEGPLTRGAKVCIVQDVVTDGTLVIDVIRRLQDEAQAQIIQVIALVDREDGANLRFESQGIEYTPIIKMSEVSKIKPQYYSGRR